ALEQISITSDPAVVGPGPYHITCSGDTDGEVLVSVANGTKPFTFTLMDEFMNPIDEEPGLIIPEKTYSGLPAGRYFFNVTDVNGCRSPYPEEIILIEPDPVSIERIYHDPRLIYEDTVDISCYGAHDGYLRVEVNGGHTSEDYSSNTYEWTGPGSYVVTNLHGDSIDEITMLGPGDYGLVITDTFGCTNAAAYNLDEPARIVMTIDSISDYNGWQIQCNGEANGYLEMMTAGGIGQFIYAWEKNDTPFGSAGPVLNGISAGSYRVTIRDSIGCSRDSVIEILEPPLLALDPDTSDYYGWGIRCYGEDDGYIILNPSGGATANQPELNTYSWTTEGGSLSDPASMDQHSLTAGLYRSTVTDINGCEVTRVFNMEEPGELIYSDFTINDALCYGSNSGSIEISILGGTPDTIGENLVYTYVWTTLTDTISITPGFTTDTLADLYSGDYYVNITDLNNCRLDMGPFEVGEADNIISILESVSGFIETDIRCYGESNGKIRASVEGGTLPYIYYWNGSTVPGPDTLVNLPAGTYGVRIVDGNGCIDTTSITLNEPYPFRYDLSVSDPLCYGDSTGSIFIAVQGGTPAYSYLWNSGHTSNVADHLPAGEWKVTVMDRNRCDTTAEATLYYPEPLSISFDTEPAYCPDTEDGWISVMTSGGVEPHTIVWNQVLENDARQSSVPAGTYVATLTDFNGCILVDTVIVDSEYASCLIIPNAFTPNGDGINDTWIIENLYLYEGVTLRIFDRWGTLVFISDNAENEHWNGTIQNRPLPIDSYHYILELPNDDPPITGNVTIIR
ncbi:MAG: gliding motility-associated C-terminal domain-containing protein, partial [Bacteroidales bacterium]|nr:gliding motility-associated C-terminal domain-containing protein [Bacteroidales bacterium]